MMRVYFSGRFSKVKEDLICQLVTFCQDQLFPEVKDVHLNFEGILPKYNDYCGDCMYEEDKEFTIRLNKRLTIPQLEITLIHEMVHVDQYLKGKEMDDTSPYLERWQEKEAHKKELELQTIFHSQ
tara:strand:- start:9 stop:383 length:375 start_codon:yes stop_codon:yes gene_type:complete